MKKYNLVDCTLRDGGYVNNWDFGSSTMICILERLISAGIDYIEIGFLDDREQFDGNRSIQPNTQCYDLIFRKVNKKSSKIMAMIDYGTCSIDNISPCEESFIDVIRVIFKKDNAKNAIEFGQALMQKGYEVFLQMVSITSYTDRDVLDFIDAVNVLKPAAVSIVDTYGLMHDQETMHYYDLLNCNLNKDIILGYHPHNNFQLAYSNVVNILQKSGSRVVGVDGTVYGMGKSAGNAPLELIAMYMNKYCDCNYDINQILEIIDVNILKIYAEKYWGYNLLYYLSASNDCHPNYISFLLEQRTLSIKAVNEIVKNIPDEFKLKYDLKCIRELYENYQNCAAVSKQSLDEFYSELKDKKILILGPGKSINTYHDKIEAYISANNATVITVNFITNRIKPDYIFVNSGKRYSIIYNEYKELNCRFKMIATSNVTSADEIFDFSFNYASLLDSDEVLRNNPLVMLLNALKRMGIKNVTLAGFDGFAKEKALNYYDKYIEFSDDFHKLFNINEAMTKKLAQLEESMTIEFITPTLYR